MKYKFEVGDRVVLTKCSHEELKPFLNVETTVTEREEVSERPFYKLAISDRFIITEAFIDFPEIGELDISEVFKE